MSTTQQRLVNQQERFDVNRKTFAKEMDSRVKHGQRLGVFSSALPLTVGDSSTNYQKERKNKDQVGLVRNFANNRGKSTCSETFNKLVSNAIGDEYQDAGQYFLRKDAGKRALSNSNFKKGFKGSLTKNSEFSHQKEYEYHHPGPLNGKVNFMARSTYEPFQKKMQYVEDAYERKEDMRKLDYQRRAAQILDKSKPFTNTVYQHECFDSMRKTFGNDRAHADKIIPKAQPPAFGAFKIGNLPKYGYNKNLGANPAYIEDPIEDTVTYQKDVARPIWRDPTHTTTTAFNPHSSTLKNTAGQLNQ